MLVLGIDDQKGSDESLPQDYAPLSSFRGAVPHFLVRPHFRDWSSDLVAVLRPAGRVENANGRLAEDLVESSAQVPKPALATSLFLHFCVIICLVRLLPFFPEPSRASQAETIAQKSGQEQSLIYQVVPVQIAQLLPSLRPSGPGGRPGKGVLPDLMPPRGSSAFHSSITIVSNPARPENPRQTIVQPNTPPDLRITHELRLPNILSGSLAESPKLSAEVKLSAPRAAAHHDEQVQAPEYVAVPRDAPILPSPAIPQPRLPLPVASSVAAPRARPGRGSGTEGVPGASASDAAANDLLVLSVDPAGGSLIALPPGNRFGDFSILPSGGLPGSPGGVPGGDVRAGSGGPGTGGDASVGVGNGKEGGGGGGNTLSGELPVSIEGSLGTMGSATAPVLAGGEPAVSVVFPVAMPSALRKPGLTFFTGSIGGAGLNVYGVLHCGKIYTVYVPMPGKKWVLEYCAPQATPPRPAETSGQVTMHPDVGLAAPTVEEQFDFKRFPVAGEEADKFIVLHGAIEENGTVSALTIYRGVVPKADVAAREAFSRWRFKPALREGKPIRVEILVGIPVSLPQ